MRKRTIQCRHSVGDVTLTHTLKVYEQTHALAWVYARVDTFRVCVYFVVVITRSGIVYLQKHVRTCLLVNRFSVYFLCIRSNGESFMMHFWNFRNEFLFPQILFSYLKEKCRRNNAVWSRGCMGILC